METTQTLTAPQQAHVAQVYPNCRDEMRNYLLAAAPVGIVKQNEVPDSPPYAIYVVAQPDFWIDCCDSPDAAATRARELGLSLETKH